MRQPDRKCDSGSLEEAGSKLALCNPDTRKHIRENVSCRCEVSYEDLVDPLRIRK